MDKKQRQSLRHCLVLCLLYGCATGSTKRQAAPEKTSLDSAAAATPVHVSMHVEALSPREQRQRLLTPEETLHSGDGLALHIEVDKPAYAYVILAPPGARQEVVYPQGLKGPQTEGQPLQPKSPLRVPGEGSWLYLDDKVGQENLFVVASLSPLERPEQALCTQLGLPCMLENDSKPPPPPPPPPPPGNLDIKSRAPDPKSGPILQAKSNDRGFAILKFSFSHEP